MILESYVQALLMLVQEGKLSIEQIKNAEYKVEIERRLEAGINEQKRI
jgi:hypothetical protein